MWFFKNFSWSRVDLQCCVSFRCPAEDSQFLLAFAADGTPILDYVFLVTVFLEQPRVCIRFQML